MTQLGDRGVPFTALNVIDTTLNTWMRPSQVMNNGAALVFIKITATAAVPFEGSHLGTCPLSHVLHRAPGALW